MLRDFLGRLIFGFSIPAKNGSECPDISVPDDLPKMRFSEQPGRRDPTLHHVGVSPARNVVGSLLHAALWTLDHVGGTQAHVQGRRELQSLQREHLLNPFSQTPRGRFVLALEESR